MKHIKTFNEEWDDYESFKNRKKIGFQQGGYSEPIAIEDKSRKRYDLLNQKIKAQEDSIKKMKEDDPSIEAEINQLNQMKRVRDKIKSENQFEGMKYLREFNEPNELDLDEWNRRYDENEKEPKWWGYQAYSRSDRYDSTKPFIVKKYFGWQEKKEERTRLGGKCGCIIIGPFRAPNEEEAMKLLKAYIKEFYDSNTNQETKVVAPTKSKKERRIMSNPLANMG